MASLETDVPLNSHNTQSMHANANSNGNSNANAMKILNASHDKAYVMRFLMGLNENYETLRSQILMLEPFPSMSRVYSLVLQEESHKHIGHGATRSSQSDTMAMYTNPKGNSNSNWNK